jgi:hypothetical protein
MGCTPVSMRITVQLDPATARNFTQRSQRRVRAKGPTAELRSALNNLSVDLTPLHPGVDDETLGSYFAIDVPDSKTAEQIVRRLRPVRGIRAAYVTPADALP